MTRPANQVKEILYEDLTLAYEFRIWFVEEKFSEEVAESLIAGAIHLRDVHEMADYIAQRGRMEVAAVQVKRKGAKASVLLYNDWP